MSNPARSRAGLRRPLAVLSVVTLTSGLVLGFGPSAGASDTAGTAGGSYGGGIQSSQASSTPARAGRPSRPGTASGAGTADPGTSGDVPTGGRVDTGGETGEGDTGGGDTGGGEVNAGGGTAPLSCTTENLDKLARATGGQTFTWGWWSEDQPCLVVHEFTSSGNFTITGRAGFPLQIMVIGAGGGGGGGSGWVDALKASGAIPDSGGGAGGAGGTVRTANVLVDPATGAFTYTSTRDGGDIDGFISTPMPTAATAHPYIKSVRIGSGGIGGTAGTSTEGSTAGGQGGHGGDSAFDELTAPGGGGGFGGRGSNSGSGDVQNGLLALLRAGGQRGGGNADFPGGDLGASPAVLHGGPGGAGASGAGELPLEVDAVNHVGEGGAGGTGINPYAFMWRAPQMGEGGGGGTIDPGSPPFAIVIGGHGGDFPRGGHGGPGGNGEDSSYGSGGGGGGTDGSVTIGDSNAGRGGHGGNGVVFVRYLALSAPETPAAPSVVAGDGSATLTITPLIDTPDDYMLWVAGDPDKNCAITPPETSCVIEGLTNGESYTFLAFAGNAAGESDTSAESVAVTLDSNAGTLPYTGNNSRDLASVALTMIGLGGGFTALARRRRTSTIS